MVLLALRKPRARALAGTDERVLVYGTGLKGFAIFSVGFVVLLSTAGLWGYFLTPDAGGWTPIGLLLILGSFWFLVVVLALEVFRVWCRFSPSFITRHSPWRGDLTIRWEEIETVGYSTVLEWFVLRTPRGTIRLQVYLDGIQEFIQMAKTRVPAERFEAMKRRATAP